MRKDDRVYRVEKIIGKTDVPSKRRSISIEICIFHPSITIDRDPRRAFYLGRVAPRFALLSRPRERTTDAYKRSFIKAVVVGLVNVTRLSAVIFQCIRSSSETVT